MNVLRTLASAGILVTLTAAAARPPIDHPAPGHGAPEVRPQPSRPTGPTPTDPPTNPIPVDPAAKPDTYVLDHTARLIDGTETPLDTYRGKVVLIVNVASRCGLTPQYAALQKLYTQKKDAGFVILGFPANDFRNQEPGTNEEIAAFCEANYGVTFPIFEKITVTGADKHPLYQDLAGQPAPIGGDPAWNFTKFLVDRSGNVVARFEPRVAPDDPRVLEAVDRLLAAERVPTPSPATPPTGPGPAPR